MTPTRRVPPAVYLCVAVVAMAGFAALAGALQALHAAPPDYDWIALAMLTWVSGAFAVKIPSTTATISVSEVFVFSVAILHGGPAATLTLALDGLFNSLYRGNRAPRRLLFNVLEPVVSMALASLVYQHVGGPPPLSLVPAPLSSLVLPVFALASTYLLLNTVLTATVIALESGSSILAIWRQHVVWLSVNFLSGASIALLLSVNMRRVSIEGLLLILPLVFLLYLVFHTWTKRVSEADAHVAAIDRLYLSTVEALAMAIESKDQVTSNHVRRVQHLSLTIARHLGVSDSTQLRAIEAGALLHDVGKVAIPDYVLNKPGRLTPEEYAIIKLHAPIGAEILSAVDFPYPVGPIVRHHHENWDGSGYPDGVAGDAIPIGARIIAVVDCFDALTSDRPYRRALSDADALAIVRERSGSMYDPAAVEALCVCYPTVREQGVHAQPQAATALIARVTAQSHSLLASRPDAAAAGPEAAAGTSRIDTLSDSLLSSGRATAARAQLGVPALAALLRTLTPATTVCIGRIDLATQSVVLQDVYGHGEQLLRGGQIAFGEGITGWVAANGAPMINSDPALDWPARIEGLSPRPAAALSVPVGAVGLLTLYADQPEGFSAAHQAIAERAARLLEPLLQPQDEPSLDVQPSPPGIAQATTDAHLFSLMSASGANERCGVLTVARLDASAGGEAGLLALTALVLPTVRLSDGLIASAHDEIIGVLPGCEWDAEQTIIGRLREALDAAPETGDLTVGFAVAASRDAHAFAAGLAAARLARRTLKPGNDAAPCAVMASERGRA